MIDAHIHLTDERFDPDRESLLRQARNAGVRSFFCVSVRPREWQKVIDLAETRDDVRPFIGTHPWYASQHDEALLREFLTRHPSAGIGETGLDAVKGDPEQERAFESQLIAAAEFNRPCVVHCVKSFDRVAALLKTLKKKPPALLFHGFSGTVQQAEFLIRFNAYFSFSGSLLNENRSKSRAVFAALPADRLLTETDAPDMRPPEKFRYPDDLNRNLPAALALIVPEMAAIRKTDFSDLVFLLRRNAERFLSGK